MKSKAAFANNYLVVLFEVLFKLRNIVDKDSVDAALDFAVYVKTVNDFDQRIFGDDVRVAARNAAVVQHDVVIFSSTDIINRAGKQVDFPTSAACVCDF